MLHFLALRHHSPTGRLRWRNTSAGGLLSAAGILISGFTQIDTSLVVQRGATTVAKGKTEGVNKSAAIREYLSSNPDAKPAEVVAALKEKGVDVKPGLVGLVKYAKSGKKAARRGKPGRKPGRKPGQAPRVAKATKGGNKSDAVRAYLADNPDASPVTVAAALKKQGLKISVSLASAVKYAKKGKKAGRPKSRRDPGRPTMSAATRASSNGALNLEVLVEAKRLAERLGGIDAAREALALLAKLA